MTGKSIETVTLNFAIISAGKHTNTHFSKNIPNYQCNLSGSDKALELKFEITSVPS